MSPSHPTPHAGAMDTPTTTEPPAGDPGPGGPGPDSGQTGPRVSSEEVRDLGRLRRSRDDRKIAGVAGGLARHLDIDPIILRVAFVVLVFFGGAGLLLYGALWLLVPEDGEVRAKIHLDPRNRTAAIVVAGTLAALALIGDTMGGYGFPWPIVIIGGIVALVLSRRDRRREHSTEYAATSAGGHAAADLGAYQGYVPPTARPSKRELYGPSLFLPTLALIAISLGAMRLVEVNGTEIPAAAYPALAIAISGAALVLGAWAGRAGSVLWIALFAGIALAASSVSGDIGADRVTPMFANEVDPTYEIGIGHLVLDLRQVADPAALDGKTITLNGQIGQIEVIVPDNIDVTAVGDVSGAGEITIFGRSDHGDNAHVLNNHEAPEPIAHITINADLNLGEITMNVEETR